MDGENENEVKLLRGYNNQLKYTDISAKDTLEKIGTILKLLQISQEGEMQRRKQCDIYYDTVDALVKNKEGSARIRTVEERESKRKYLTLKSKTTTRVIATEDALVRAEKEYEIECDDDGEQALKSYMHELYRIPKSDCIFQQIQVDNERNYCHIETKLAKYELSYDKFKYTNPLDYSESQYFYEIEIELKEESKSLEYKRDPQIDSLVELLKELMGFEHDGMNKYNRGMEWKEKRNRLFKKKIIVFDIVGYSKEYTFEQMRKVEKFTAIVKKYLYMLGNTESIPLGDGLILIIPEKSNQFPFIQKIFESLRKINSNREEAQQIHIRTALHIGEVMVYQDINENRNYAGQGINIAYRINTGAKKDQVLVSENFYNYMQEKGELENENYCKVAPLTVKHDVKINVYNYYDSNLLVGKRAQ